MPPQKRKRNDDSSGTSSRKNSWQAIDLSIPTGFRENKRNSPRHHNHDSQQDKKKRQALLKQRYRREGLNKCHDATPRIERMRSALKGLSSGKYSTIHEAASTNGVHYDQIQRRATGKIKWYRRNGPEPFLTIGEERHLAQWVITMRDTGFPVSPKQLKDTVQDMVKKDSRETPFKNDRPSNGWYTGFLRRNPSIKLGPTKSSAKERHRQKKENRSSTQENKSQEYKCPVCGKQYSESVMVGWVGCDGCNEWYHLSCMPKKLVTARMLKKKEWFCPKCRSKGIPCN